jgi:hypothetical protein
MADVIEVIRGPAPVIEVVLGPASVIEVERGAVPVIEIVTGQPGPPGPPGVSAQAVAGAIGVVIDGGSNVITPGVKAFVEVPFPCRITAVTLLSTDPAVTPGSIVFDVWKDTYANYPPTGGDTITASAKPTLSNAVKSHDATLVGWTTAIVAGEVLGFRVESAALLTRVSLSLTVEAT